MAIKKLILVFLIVFVVSILCIALSYVFFGFYGGYFQVAAFVLSVTALILLNKIIKTQIKKEILITLKIIRVVTIMILVLSGINTIQVVFGDISIAIARLEGF